MAVGPHGLGVMNTKINSLYSLAIAAKVNQYGLLGLFEKYSGDTYMMQQFISLGICLFAG